MNSREDIAGYWKTKAEQFGDDPTATIRDFNFFYLEIDTICERYLLPEDRVLDVGCGSGYATTEFAKRVRSIVGIDACVRFIKAAQKAQLTGEVRNVEFQTADALKLPFNGGKFDVVISQRTLINLPTRADQAAAVEEIRRVLRPGGKYIMCEVTQQGHGRCNAFRNKFGLNNLKVHWHNLYLDEDNLPTDADSWELIDHIQFGMYEIISRVVHPLLVAPEKPRFDNKINDISRRVSAEFLHLDVPSPRHVYVFAKR